MRDVCLFTGNVRHARLISYVLGRMRHKCLYDFSRPFNNSQDEPFQLVKTNKRPTRSSSWIVGPKDWTNTSSEIRSAIFFLLGGETPKIVI